MNVPLKAAFSGIRRLPWIALASSSIAPRLIIGETGIDYRVVGALRSRAYGEIESVDFRAAWRTRNIVFSFTGSAWTFAGNVADDAAARAALRRLRERGCPLTQRAVAFAAGG